MVRESVCPKEIETVVVGDKSAQHNQRGGKRQTGEQEKDKLETKQMTMIQWNEHTLCTRQRCLCLMGRVAKSTTIRNPGYKITYERRWFISTIK